VHYIIMVLILFIVLFSQISNNHHFLQTKTQVFNTISNIDLLRLDNIKNFYNYPMFQNIIHSDSYFLSKIKLYDNINSFNIYTNFLTNYNTTVFLVSVIILTQINLYILFI
jgi:hypothetical protein